MASIVGILVFMVLWIISRVIGERALSRLTNEQKVQLLDGFSKHRAYVGIPILALMVLMLVAVYAMPSRAEDIATLDLSFAVLILAVFHVVVLRKLEVLGLPNAYVKAWLLARALGLAGYVILFVSIGYSSLQPR